MQITTVMVVIFVIWCPLTLILHGPAQIPPPPLPHNLHFTDESLGWFKGTIFPAISFVAIIIAFGHSLLSMSGFETLAQVYREIAYPKQMCIRDRCDGWPLNGNKNKEGVENARDRDAAGIQNGQQQDSQRTPRDQCLGQMCEQLTMLPPVPPPGRSGWWGGSPEPPRTPPSAC